MSNPDSHKARNWVKSRFVKFIFVGMMNSLLGYTCFALFLFAGFHYSLALLMATVIGVAFNFKSTGTFVFGSNDNRLIIRFIGAYIVTYFINVIGIDALSYVGVAPYISGAILIFPMAVMTFLFNKRFVFNHD